jgi:homocysteine S-methyltransferase
MPDHREALPQLGDRIFLTDSGLETDLIFRRGFELPAFAAFPLLDTEAGRGALVAYYREHIDVAVRHGSGLILETPTWRASADWGRQLGYDQNALDRSNRDAVDLMLLVAGVYGVTNAVISGCIGPRADGYHPRTKMTAQQARDYHRPQLATFAATPADMANAMTITYPDEAIGIAAAANDLGLPVAISFTLELDGRLPDGTPLSDAVGLVDSANSSVAYYGVNCAHPDHIAAALEGGASWTSRVRALRANASRLSHAELDEASELDDGDPVELATGYQYLRELAHSLTVLGGCCGTDVRHVSAIADVVVQ